MGSRGRIARDLAYGKPRNSVLGVVLPPTAPDQDNPRRTCPGGGKGTAAASAVKSIDLNTNHAKSPMAGIQRVVEALKDFKVEKMTGDIKPGGTLSGKIVGNLDKTAFTFDFELNLPAKDAAAGMGCK